MNTLCTERLGARQYELYFATEYETYMDYAEKLNHPEAAGDRLKDARKRAGFESAMAAAKQFGWTASAYNHHESGQRKINADLARVYGRAFGVNPAWILWGDSVLEKGVRVPVRLIIAAGSKIHSMADYPAGYGFDNMLIADRVNPEQVVAARVDGESMLSAGPLGYRHGDKVAGIVQTSDFEQHVHKECIVKLTTGETQLKVLERGDGDGFWDLISLNSAFPPVKDVTLEWIAPIRWIEKAS